MLRMRYLLIAFFLTSSMLSAAGFSGGTAFLPGEIRMYGGANAPNGWLVCDGSIVNIASYPGLYQALGTAYNRSGESAGVNFRLPDIRGIFPIGAGTSGVYGSNYAGTRGGYGQDSTQGHKHAISDSSTPLIMVEGTGGSTLVGGGGVGVFYMNVYNTNTPKTDGSNGTPRNGAVTLPASVGVTYIIKY